MTSGSQDLMVFAIVAPILAFWAQKLTRPLWLPHVSGWLLKRGHVALAMRLRFGKRGH